MSSVTTLRRLLSVIRYHLREIVGNVRIATKAVMAVMMTKEEMMDRQQRREHGLRHQHRQQRRMRMNRPSRMEGRKVMQSSCIILAMAWNHLPIIKKIMLRYVVEGLGRRVRLKNHAERWLGKKDNESGNKEA